MEKINIKKFLSIRAGSGEGSGAGEGSGEGSGSGAGEGSGAGAGWGSGSGAGWGSGEGAGAGAGLSWGEGSGSGSSSSWGEDIKSINSDIVYMIDNVPTIIKHIKGNVAKGFILNSDLSLSPCYIVKGHNKFAHGKTLKKALEDLQNKIFEDIDTDEAIQLFLEEFSDLNKKYPAKDFYIWHNRLTGSCEMGRNSFVKNGGYDLENDMFTVQEFIDITKNAYGGEIIKELEEKIKNEHNNL